jgi:DNA-binding transcriptional ArsR family regulator
MEDELREHLLPFFRALADETRLQIVGMLAAHERSVEEIAAALALRMPTISHHLAKLREAGLVSMRREGTTHYYALNVAELHARSRALLAPPAALAQATDTVADAWERKVLRDFFDGDRLREIPASRKKRAVILRWLAHQFNPAQTYTEAQVNDILSRYHEDVATLRREMIGASLLKRAGGIYRLAVAE